LAGAPADAASAPAMPAVPALAGEAGGAPSAPLPWIAPWLVDLQRDARRRLDAGEIGVWDMLTRQFEAQLIRTALEHTRGRRIEAALKLGIGRNTITRKIQDLGLDE
jgi:two-component system nitrogen regulation response regulator GlnG